MRRIFIPVGINPAPLRPPIGLYVRTMAGATMGTTWSVKAAVPGGLQLDRLQYEIEEALAEIVRQMSPWEEQSCLSVFNRAPAGTWHRLPEEFFAVLAEATRIAEQTAGAFDPTVGSLVNRAGFGPILPTEPRSERDPTTARRSGLPLNPVTRSVLQPGGVQLDLCAIAKGFAVDRVSELLLRHELPDHLVEIGGECRGSGLKPDGTPWWVAIEWAGRSPGSAAPDAVVALHGVSIATSGGYRRYRREGEACITHLVDPRTGHALDDVVTTATVVFPRCMVADAWATALAVLGPEKGLRLAATHDIAALFTLGKGNAHRLEMSPAMAAMLN